MVGWYIELWSYSLSWLVHNSIASTLGKPIFGVPQSLVEGVEYSNVHDPIISSDNVEKVVYNGGHCIATRCGHVWNCLPLACTWVVSVVNYEC